MSAPTRSKIENDAALYALAGLVVAYRRHGIPTSEVWLWPFEVNGKAGTVRTQNPPPAEIQFTIELMASIASQLPRWRASRKYPTFVDHFKEGSGRGLDTFSPWWIGLAAVDEAISEIDAVAAALLRQEPRVALV